MTFSSSHKVFLKTTRCVRLHFFKSFYGSCKGFTSVLSVASNVKQGLTLRTVQRQPMLFACLIDPRVVRLVRAKFSLFLSFSAKALPHFRVKIIFRPRLSTQASTKDLRRTLKSADTSAAQVDRGSMVISSHQLPEPWLDASSRASSPSKSRPYHPSSFVTSLTRPPMINDN